MSYPHIFKSCETVRTFGWRDWGNPQIQGVQPDHNTIGSRGAMIKDPEHQAPGPARHAATRTRLKEHRDLQVARIGLAESNRDHHKPGRVHQTSSPQPQYTYNRQPGNYLEESEAQKNSQVFTPDRWNPSDWCLGSAVWLWGRWFRGMSRLICA